MDSKAVSINKSPPQEDWEAKKAARTAAYKKFVSRGGAKNPGSKDIPQGSPDCRISVCLDWCVRESWKRGDGRNCEELGGQGYHIAQQEHQVSSGRWGSNDLYDWTSHVRMAWQLAISNISSLLACHFHAILVSCHISIHDDSCLRSGQANCFKRLSFPNA